MPIANIEINAVATGGVDVPINVAVQLSNADVGGETTYAWTITDQPEGAADALSNPAIENPTFTPKKEGSYRVKLVVNAGQASESIDFAVVSVLEFRSAQRFPAAGELLERSSARGWAEAVLRTNKLFDKRGHDGNIVVATATAGMAVGSIVVLASAVDTIKATLPGAEVVARAALFGAGTVGGTLGIIIGVCDGGSIAAGKLVLVRIGGLVEFTEPGTPAVGDLVYVDNSGEPSLTLTAATHPRLLGRVVEVSGGNYRWVIEGREGRWCVARRLTSPIEGVDVGGGLWALSGGTASNLSWLTSNAAATGLLLSIKAGVQDTVRRIELYLDQGGATALVDVTLMRGTATVGGGAQANVVTSAGVGGAQTLNVAPVGGALTLPYTLEKGEEMWVHVAANGGGGTNRRVGVLTAFVTPP